MIEREPPLGRPAGLAIGMHPPRAVAFLRGGRSRHLPGTCFCHHSGPFPRSIVALFGLIRE
jgi:hypothetical protein